MKRKVFVSLSSIGLVAWIGFLCFVCFSTQGPVVGSCFAAQNIEVQSEKQQEKETVVDETNDVGVWIGGGVFLRDDLATLLAVSFDNREAEEARREDTSEVDV